MDLANDERIQVLNDQIQNETDPERVIALVNELATLLDDSRQKTDA
jgi:hypothetical protein